MLCRKKKYEKWDILMVKIVKFTDFSTILTHRGMILCFSIWKTLLTLVKTKFFSIVHSTIYHLFYLQH